MALIIDGHTKCGLCGQVITAGEKIIGLPAISDTSNSLYEYFDQGFHLACFESWDKKKEISKILQEEKIKYENSAYYKDMMLKYSKPGNSD